MNRKDFKEAVFELMMSMARIQMVDSFKYSWSDTKAMTEKLYAEFEQKLIEDGLNLIDTR